MRCQNLRQPLVAVRRLVHSSSAEDDVGLCQPFVHHLRLDALSLDPTRLAIGDAGNGAVERCTRLDRIDTLQNHRLLAHRSTDEASLAGEGRRRSLTADPQFPAVVLFQSRKVVVMVISKPTAVGLMRFSVAIIPPIGTPYPRCPSAIRA